MRCFKSSHCSVNSASLAEECKGLSNKILAALFCVTCSSLSNDIVLVPQTMGAFLWKIQKWIIARDHKDSI